MADLVPIQKKLQRSQALDGFRGLGCLLVMLGHTQWKGRTILPGALVAMDMFFVLSGFLITGLLLAELAKTNTISLVSFWKRRAIRLLPSFYLYFSVVAIVYGISKFQLIVGTSPRVSLLSTAFYASNWAVAKGYDLGVYFVTWSLSLEEQFYFLCPMLLLILFKFFDKKKILLLLVLSIIAVNFHRFFLFQGYCASEGILSAFKQIFYRLDTRSDALLIGCFGAVLYNLYGEKIRIREKIAIPAAVLLLGLILFVRDMPVAYHLAEGSPFTSFLMGGGFTVLSLLGLVCIIHFVQMPKSILTRLFEHRYLVQVGIMSYSIYLWHTTVFGGLEIALASMNRSLPLWILKTVIRFAVAFAIGYSSFTFIERPSLEYLFKKRKFSSLPKVEAYYE